VEYSEHYLPVKHRKEWDSVERYIEYLRHFTAYKYVEEFVKDKSVLEVGCGTGYGANYLTRFASTLTAADISKQCVTYCHNSYGKAKMNLLCASGLSLPIRNSSFDVVVSFQVIEHIEPKRVAHFLSEIKRILKDGGVFVISTPNKRLRLLPFQKPEARNPEHKKEYTSKELKKLFHDFFEEVKVYGLKGSPEIQSLVLNQLRQNPSDIYRVIISRIAKPLLPFMKKSVSSARIKITKTKPRAKTPKKLRIGGFKIFPSCPKDSLDFIVFAKKGQSKHEGLV